MAVNCRPPRPKHWLPGLVAGLGLAALAWALPAAAAAPEPLPLSPCRLRGVPTEALCGTLQRPLDPTQPQGRHIGIRVAVLPALARLKHPDPMVLLAGGPGQSAIALADLVQQRWRRLNQRRDIVLVDQRGTGDSAPLHCPDARALPLAQQFDEAAALRRLADCRAALARLPHGDLRHYSTAAAMQDLDAVRLALGIARWNLVGASYGTRAGLDYLRQFPHAVRRAVLDGLAPPDMALPASNAADAQAAFDSLLQACAAEPACAQRHPRLAEQWQALLASLPRQVRLRHPATGREEAVRLTRPMLRQALRAPLYVPALASALPAAIALAAEGQFDALAGLAGSLGGQHPAMRLAIGMHHAVVCSEDMPRIATDRLAAAAADPDADADLARYQAACAGWPRAAVAPDFYTVPPAPVAVLLASGGADPVTPPRHGERVAQALGPRARHVVVHAAGHGVLALPCLREAAQAFIDAATDAQALALPLDCAAALPRPLAYRPPDPAAAPPAPPAPPAPSPPPPPSPPPQGPTEAKR